MYEKDIVYGPETQEALAQLVSDRLKERELTRKEAAAMVNITADKLSILSRTAPAGMPYGYFLKAMLGLDIDLYQVCRLLHLTEEVEELARKEPENYVNFRRAMGEGEGDPLTTFVKTLPTEKQERARVMIQTILENM